MENTASLDRLNFTLLFSILIHMVLLLGVGFTVSSPPVMPLANLDITLVKQQTELEPEKADYLAQANNEGGGETDEKSPEPTPEKPVKETPVKDVSKTKASPAAKAMPVPVPVQTVEKSSKLITQTKADRLVQSNPDLIKKPKPSAKPTPPVKPKLTASEMMLQARNEISLLEQKLDLTTKALSKKTNKRRLSSSTKEYAAAAYHEAWRKKVERLGNLNYPSQARRQGLNGSLMLSVDINPDGSVPPNGIVISRSSGHKLLDDAAIKIVRLGAPYAPIPDNVLQGHDVITIIRTWKFETDGGLLSR